MLLNLPSLEALVRGPLPRDRGNGTDARRVDCLRREAISAPSMTTPFLGSPIDLITVDKEHLMCVFMYVFLSDIGNRV